MLEVTIELRHDTAAAWAAQNPVLGPGEKGIETDTGREKNGNGVTHWMSLPYVDASAGLAAETAARVAGDTANAALVTAEATARALAVSSETTRATAAESTNATAISTETTRATTAEALKAPLASPALTGTPTAPTPTTANGIANKSYIDGLVQGGFSNGHEAVVVGTANRALSGLPTLDGMVLTDGQTALLTGQSTGSQNGLWAVHSGAWTRPTFFASGADVAGAYVFVQSGTVYGGALFALNGASPQTVDTTALTFVQFDRVGDVQADETSIHKAGNTFSAIIGTTTGTVGDGGVLAGKAPLLIPVTPPVTAGAALAVNRLTPVDATAGPLTMTLPTGQPAGAPIACQKTDASTNAVTVSGSIRGVNTTITLVLLNETIDLIADAAGSWWPSASHKTLGSLDGRYTLLPQTTDKTIYVRAGTSASDANTGLSPQAAKATLAAAKTALGGTSGVISLGYGSYALPAEFDLDQVGMVLSGAGMYLTDLVVTSAMTSALRIVDAGRCTLRDLRVTIGAGGAVTSGILVDTSAGSTETTRLDNVIVEVSGGGTMTNAVWIGDVAGDTSEVMLTNVRVAGATEAGIKCGTGTTNNVLNVRCYSCDVRGCLYGVELAGAGLIWVGGTSQGNTGADFKMTSPGTAPVLIEGIRSEGSKRFWECNGNFTSASNVTLSSINVRSFTDAGGVVLDHEAAVGLILTDFLSVGGAAPTVFTIFGVSSTYRCRLKATNIITDVSNPFGALTNVIADIFGVSKYEAGTGKQIDSTVNSRIDGLVTMPGGWDAPFGTDFESTAGPHAMMVAYLASVAPSVAVAAANNAQAVRWVPRRSFTIAKLLWFVGTVGASGNYDLAILDASQNRLWSLGSTAVPAANTTVIATVGGGVAVVAGTTYYLVLALDNTTSKFLGVQPLTDLIRDRHNTVYSSQVASSFPVPNPLGTLSSSTRLPLLVVRDA